jgi:thiosulfate/3-mercaptopyruvate sulfurtransferase
VALPYDSAAKFREYAHPEMIVTTEWVAEHMGDPGLVVAESDEDVLLYETGHIPGAVKLDWHTELNDPVTRDYVDGARFARLMSEKGISRDTTLVLYGDKNNWWAAYALWVCSLFGHADLRLMDGRSSPGARSRGGRTTRSSSATTASSARSRTRCSTTLASP